MSTSRIMMLLRPGRCASTTWLAVAAGSDGPPSWPPALRAKEAEARMTLAVSSEGLRTASSRLTPSPRASIDLGSAAMSRTGFSMARHNSAGEGIRPRSRLEPSGSKRSPAHIPSRADRSVWKACSLILSGTISNSPAVSPDSRMTSTRPRWPRSSSRLLNRNSMQPLESALASRRPKTVVSPLPRPRSTSVEDSGTRGQPGPRLSGSHVRPTRTSGVAMTQIRASASRGSVPSRNSSSDTLSSSQRRTIEADWLAPTLSNSSRSSLRISAKWPLKPRILGMMR